MPALTHREIIGILPGLILATFLAALEQTIVATALPTIARDLHDFDLLGWVVSAYLLAATTATPVIGKLGDLYGRRIVMKISLLIFMVSSLLCALAPTMPVLIAARVLQGIGGAGLLVTPQAAMADLVAPRERGRYVAYFSIVWAMAALLGPLLGGVLTQYLDWPAIFLINLPLGIVILFTADRRLKALPHHPRAGRIDAGALISFTIGSTSLLLGLSWIGGGRSPAAPEVLAALAGAVLFGLRFAWTQITAAEPIIPPSFMRHPVVAPATAVIGLSYGLYLAIAVLTPTYFQIGLGTSATGVGLLLIPVMLSSSITAVISGRFVARTGTYRLPPVLGMPVAAGALILLGWFAPSLSGLEAMGLLVVIGLGIGPIFPIINVVAQNAVAPTDIGAVSGSMSFFRNLGASILTTMGSAILLGRVGSTGGQSLDHLLQMDQTHLPEATHLAFRHAFGGLFLAGAAITLLALVLFLCIEHRELRSTTAMPHPGDA